MAHMRIPQTTEILFVLGAVFPSSALTGVGFRRSDHPHAVPLPKVFFLTFLFLRGPHTSFSSCSMVVTLVLPFILLSWGALTLKVTIKKLLDSRV